MNTIDNELKSLKDQMVDLINESKKFQPKEKNKMVELLECLENFWELEYKALELVVNTDSLSNSEKEGYFEMMYHMTEEQKQRLFDILETERAKLVELEANYQKQLNELNETEMVAAGYKGDLILLFQGKINYKQFCKQCLILSERVETIKKVVTGLETLKDSYTCENIDKESIIQTGCKVVMNISQETGDLFDNYERYESN